MPANPVNAAALLAAVTERVTSVDAMSQQALIVGGVVMVVVVALFLSVEIPFRYLLRNLVVRWRTTVMTALAFVMVIGLLTVMLAFVNGMVRLTEASGHPGNVMVLADGSTDESFSNLGYLDVGDIQNQAGILRDNDQPLCSKETYILVTQPIENAPPGRPKRFFLQVRGVDDSRISGRVHAMELHAEGEWLSDAGVREASKSSENSTADGKEASRQPMIEAVIGEGVARILAGIRDTGMQSTSASQPLKAGDTFQLGERTWYVAGVMQSAGSTFDSEVWAKRSMIGPMFGKENYTSFVVRSAGPREAQALKTFFNNDYKKAAVSAQVETEYFANLAGTSRQFLWAIAVVTVFMAVGGVVGVANTMFAAVSNRTKDIGVLRLMGYSRTQVMLAFLLESLVIAIVGGALGCALGSLVDGWTASSIVSGSGGGGKSVVLKLVVNAQTIGVGLLLSLLMGGIGGFFPAASAVRLRPLEALR